MTITTVYSCTKDQDEITQSEGMRKAELRNTRSLPTRSDEFSLTELGRLRQNPYTVNNMTEAFKKVYQNSNINKLQPTHYYVKFSPTNREHLISLEKFELDDNVPLFDFPLEYEITHMGDMYVDPSITVSDYTYQYAAIEKSILIYPNVPYQVLDALFIPPYESYVTETAFFQVGEHYDTTVRGTSGSDGLGGVTDDPDEVDPEMTGACTPDCDNYPCCFLPSHVCNNTLCSQFFDPPCEETDLNWPECLWENDDPVFINNACGCGVPPPNKPAGCIQVVTQNLMGVNNVGVNNVRVKTKDSWFGAERTQSNSLGCWRADGFYSGRVWVWVQFANEKSIFRNPMVPGFENFPFITELPIRKTSDYLGVFDGDFNNIEVEYTPTFGNQNSLMHRFWASSITNNTVEDYFILAQGDGILVHSDRLNFYLNSQVGAAGAPMLKYSGIISLEVAVPATYLGVEWLIPISTNINPGYFSYYLPDITNNYGNDDSDEIIETSFHEMAHSSHYTQVGENYWSPYRSHVVNNFLDSGEPYGLFPNFAIGSSPGIVALGEAFGDFIQNRYSGSDAGGEVDLLEDGFIPSGLLLDLVDNNPDLFVDPITGVTVNDNISGFTPAMIFGAMTSNVTSIREFRNRLRTNSISETNNTNAAYNSFVDAYDVFN